MTFRLLMSLAKKISRREVNRAITDFVMQIPANAKVLNVGAGGDVLKTIKKALLHQSITIQSTDIDPDRKPDIVDDLVNTKLAAESFDYIICSEVIEHVTHPHIAADNLYQILKAGGGCLITTPYIFPTHDAPHDHFRFTEFGLRNLFSKFEIISLEAKTTWWETFVLLAWRQMWLGDTKAKIVVWLISFLLLPIFPAVYLCSRKKKDPAFTAGFVLSLVKR